MQYDEASFFAILRKKFFGNPLSQEEETYLQEVLDQHEEARELRNIFSQAFTHGDFREYLENNDSTAEAEKIIERSRHDRRKRLQIVYAAASVLLILGIAIYLIFGRKVARQISENAIVLETPIGKKVEVPENKSLVKAGNVVLNTDSASVKITSAGATDDSKGMNTLTVPAAKKYTVVLADGTIVYLNAKSSLCFPSAFANSREIRLQGEAYLKVNADVNKPFIVHTPLLTIEVLGTEFNVNTSGLDTVRVAVTQGSVRVKTTTEKLVVTPGQEAVTFPGNKIEIRSFDRFSTLAWLSTEYVFTNESLQKVMEVVRSKFGAETIYLSPETRKLEISGTITKNMTLTQFITYLNVVSSLHTALRNDTIVISKK